MEVIEAMNTCNEVCIKKKNAQPFIQNINSKKCTTHKSICSEQVQTLATQKSKELSRTPQLKVSVPREYNNFQRSSFKEYFLFVLFYCL